MCYSIAIFDKFFLPSMWIERSNRAQMRQDFSPLGQIPNAASNREHTFLISTEPSACLTDSTAVSDLCPSSWGRANKESERDNMELPESVQNVSGVDVLCTSVF